ncbi:hypothetical protein FBQ82_13085 [Anaerolineae bacterium CFX7]|nr:hypothetical protein [Anaerolineae bacterium CFX7]
MDHVQATAPSHSDPGDFAAEEARIKKANPNYLGVFLVLAVLTAIEIALTTLFENTIGRVPILLALTVAKALLVVLYYMHLKFDSKIYSWFFGGAVFAFALPFVIALVFLLAPPELLPVREALGGGGGEAAARPTRNPNAGPPMALEMDSGDYFFKPDSLSPNSGQVVRLTLVNSGSVEHNFTLPDVTKDKAAEPFYRARARRICFLLQYPGPRRIGNARDAGCKIKGACTRTSVFRSQPLRVESFRTRRAIFF